MSVGITHDTAQFAVASIRRWWTEMGAARFPRARKRMITADGDGSDSRRNRLFCFITQNWRGRPLTSLQTIVERIGSTTTKTGLTVRAALDEAEYETGIKVSDERLAQVKLKRSQFHGDWNDAIYPRKN